jgi:hypothetical protein
VLIVTNRRGGKVKIRIVFFLLAVSTSSVFAQSPDSLQREAMKKLDWWVGEWKGEAWSSMGPGRGDTTLMVESVKKDLEGTILLIEGVGHRKLAQSEEGEIVHHALAILSFDARKGTYRWQAWRTPGGIYTDTEPTVADRQLQWGMETPRGQMRYSLRLSDKEEWEETGEFSADGKTWHPFFGMSLTRSR